MPFTPTYTHQQIVDYVQRLVKGIPISDIDEVCVDQIHSIFWRAYPWRWTRSTLTPVTLVNKPGASGAIGIQSVAMARPDGYTLLLALPPLVTIPEADRMFGRTPGFTRDQFAPLALTTADPTIVVVNANPTVTFSAIADLCVYNPALNLNQGSPAGGTYAGNGVSGGAFDPATAGLGTSTLTYTFIDGNGCVGMASTDVFVDDCAAIVENG